MRGAIHWRGAKSEASRAPVARERTRCRGGAGEKVLMGCFCQ
jgi:hypothetical protein